MSDTAAGAAVGPPPGMRVRLSSNESPAGPSPKAVDAARGAAERLHLYPDDQSVALREAVGESEGVPAEQVAMGTGSAALLMDCIAQQCADADAGADTPEVLAFEHSFIVYRLAARNARARYVEVPDGGAATGDGDGYARDPDALLDAVTDATRLVVIDNPGNPTGAHLGAEGLAAIAAGVPDHVTLVVDEAYWHYATGQRDYARIRDLDVDHPRLLVLSTFSKAHGLAGLRVGHAVGPAELIGPIDTWRTRFNVNAVAQAAALASLQDRDHLERTVTQTIEDRARQVAGLREIGVPLTDGLGNFTTIELGEAAGPYVEAFAADGVGVRPLAPYGMGQQLRVSVGLPDEVDAFLDSAAGVLADAPTRT